MFIPHGPTSRTLSSLALGLTLGLAGCASESSESSETAQGVVAAETETTAPAAVTDDPETIPREGGPRIGAIQIKAPIYEAPNHAAKVLGYLRAGATVTRAEKPVATDDCEGGWYRVLPFGVMCASNDATIDLEHPILRALTRRPDRSKPLPYSYAFVRAVAPRYYRVPTKAEQFQYEMSLDRHLRSYERMASKWDALRVGANDIELDEDGNAIGLAPEEPPELDYNEFYGGDGDDAIPWFFEGKRHIPNISTFKVPDYAVITNRIKRKAMLASIGTFVGPNDRRFAITTDARLVPTSKLKPDRGSVFHGVDLRGGWKLPLAFVKESKVWSYDVSRRSFEKADRLERHLPLQLTGRSTKIGDQRLVETIHGTYVKDTDVAIAALGSSLPSFAKKDQKWIDISIFTQTMVLYEGDTPIYATMVSTGRDGLGDPGKTLSTPTGTFHIYDKHLTTTMDSTEVGNQFELKDVPWVQYFKGGYALHAALWHDDFGRPRSHGCVNMSPIDARRVFMWTTPDLPEDWHGIDVTETTGPGTIVHIHP